MQHFRSIPASQSTATLRPTTTAQQASLVSPIDDPSPLRGRYSIPAKEVRKHLERIGQSMDEFLLSLIQPASRLAKPPVSGFHVG